MTAAAAWLVAGLVLAGAEMVVPGLFLLPVGLAALGTGLVATVVAEAAWQFGAFALLALSLVGGAAPLLRRRTAADRINAPASGLLGETCRALVFEGHEGRVAFRDGQWQARLPTGTASPGDALRIAGLDGTVLLVKPVEGETP